MTKLRTLARPMGNRPSDFFGRAVTIQQTLTPPGRDSGTALGQRWARFEAPRVRHPCRESAQKGFPTLGPLSLSDRAVEADNERRPTSWVRLRQCRTRGGSVIQ